MIRCLILLSALATVTLNAGWAVAQSAVNNQACVQAFAPLREEAENRSRLIKAASERRAPPEEACRLIGEFAKSEARMVKYLEANSDKCGIPWRVVGPAKTSHQRTQAVLTKVCAVARQKREPVGDFGHISNIGLRSEPAWPRGPVGDFWIIR